MTIILIIIGTIFTILTLINGASYDTYTLPVLNAESDANISVSDAGGFQVKVLGAGALCWPYLSFFSHNLSEFK